MSWLSSAFLGLDDLSHQGAASVWDGIYDPPGWALQQATPRDYGDGLQNAFEETQAAQLQRLVDYIRWKEHFWPWTG